MSRDLIDTDFHKIAYAVADKYLTYTVGQEVYVGRDKCTITSIIKDLASYQTWGTQVYYIYAINSLREQFKFRIIENCPVELVPKHD